MPLTVMPVLHNKDGKCHVQVEQEEYDEVVVIKAMFLNHDYQ